MRATHTAEAEQATRVDYEKQFSYMHHRVGSMVTVFDTYYLWMVSMIHHYSLYYMYTGLSILNLYCSEIIHEILKIRVEYSTMVLTLYSTACIKKTANIKQSRFKESTKILNSWFMYKSCDTSSNLTKWTYPIICDKIKMTFKKISK